MLKANYVFLVMFVKNNRTLNSITVFLSMFICKLIALIVQYCYLMLSQGQSGTKCQRNFFKDEIE